MVSPNPTSISLSLFLLFSYISSSFSLTQSYETFLSCLSLYTPNSNLSQILYTPNTPSYTTLLNSSIQNLRFKSPTTTKPIIILTPSNEQEIQASVLCCKNQNIPIRIRSGGHDYEGLSYRSLNSINFAMIDLTNLRSIRVDTDREIAWVESGTTLGELYYEIAKKSDNSLGFPAGTCPTVCVGGHFSGGGLGNLVRKYGLSSDNILDAKLVVANGKILDRETMGEDLFWAIRGGGGASFGIVVSWKVRLVRVPQIVSVFTINRTLEQGAIGLINKWQYIAHSFYEDIFLKVDIEANMNGKEAGAVFKSQFLGRCSDLLSYLQVNFPELGLQASDCREMSWIQSVVYFAGYGESEPQKILLDRGLQPKIFNKGTSDYVTDPIPLNAWKGILNKFMDKGTGSMYMDPQGGIMNEILESDTPYPHRKGILYSIQYLVKWREHDDVLDDKYLGWVRGLRSIMTPYVSKNPRGAYVNFRDLDLGINEEGNTDYSEARVWGEMYFKSNFRRLALVKSMVDQEQFFWHEQSIPPLFLTKERVEIK